MYKLYEKFVNGETEEETEEDTEEETEEETEEDTEEETEESEEETEEEIEEETEEIDDSITDTYSSVDNFFSFINTDISNDNIKLIMTFMIILCVLALLFFLIENNIITGKFVMFFMVVSIFMYMYNNRLYTDRIDDLKSQIDINSLSDVITKMCNSTPDSDFCVSFLDEQQKYNDFLQSYTETE